jgi:ATP-binding cassette subfamily C protein
MNGGALLNRLLFQQKWRIFLFTILLIFSGALEVSFAYIIQIFIDSLTGKNVQIFLWSIFGFITFLITNLLLHCFAVITEANLSKNLHIALKNKLVQTILLQDLTKFQKTSSGEKLNLFENDLSIIEQSYFKNIFTILKDLLLFIFAFTFLFSTNWIITLIIVFLSILSFIIPAKLGNKIDELVEKYSQKNGDFLEQLQNIFDGIVVIKSFAIEKVMYKITNSKLFVLENSLYKLKIKTGFWNQIMVTFQYLIISICFLLGGKMIFSGEMTLGELMGITQLLNLIIQPINAIATAFIEISGTKSIRQKIEKYLNIPKKNLWRKKLKIFFHLKTLLSSKLIT